MHQILFWPDGNCTRMSSRNTQFKDTVLKSRPIKQKQGFPSIANPYSIKDGLATQRRRGYWCIRKGLINLTCVCISNRNTSILHRNSVFDYIYVPLQYKQQFSWKNCEPFLLNCFFVQGAGQYSFGSFYSISEAITDQADDL